MPMTLLRARAFSALAASLVAASLAGCSSPAAAGCSQEAYRNTADVLLQGTTEAVDRVALIQWCDENGCSGNPEQVDPSTADTVALPAYSASSPNKGRWTFDMSMTEPAQATLTAFDANATVLDETTVDLKWSRVDPSDTCDGPSTAGVLSFPLGS